jgi:hypothetical protein
LSGDFDPGSPLDVDPAGEQVLHLAVFYRSQHGVRTRARSWRVERAGSDVIGHRCRARVYRREMGLGEAIDITFDFRSDTPHGRDPDTLSPTLRRYHQLLWSNPLPSGAPFELDVTTPHTYLHHLSELGEFFLSSDAVIPTFLRELRLAHIIDQIPELKREAFHHIGYTIGGMMVFPGNRVGRKMTINGARGFYPRIKDRFDLTLSASAGITLTSPAR